MMVVSRIKSYLAIIFPSLRRCDWYFLGFIGQTSGVNKCSSRCFMEEMSCGSRTKTRREQKHLYSALSLL